MSVKNPELRFAKLESNVEGLMENRKEQNSKIEKTFTLVTNIDKQFSNLLTEIKGEGGMFKRVTTLESKTETGANERDDILLLIAKNKSKDARLVAFIFAFGVVIGFLTDKLSDYYEDQLQSRSETGIILYHKPFDYNTKTKIL